MPNPEIIEKNDTREPVQPAEKSEQSVLVMHHYEPSPETFPPQITPETLIARAIDKGLDVATMERLLAMRTQLKQEMAREAYFAALAAFQAAVPVVPKSKTATVVSKSGGRYQYHYADLADIGKAIGPALAENGLSYRFNTAFQAEPPAQLIQCIVQHVGGHSEVSEFRSPIDTEARMLEVQKNGSALTYGKRYALCNALGILTADEDDDGQATAKPPAHESGAWKAPSQAPTGKSAKAASVDMTQAREDWILAFKGAASMPELMKVGSDFGNATKNPDHPLHADPEIKALYISLRDALRAPATTP